MYSLSALSSNATVAFCKILASAVVLAAHEEPLSAQVIKNIRPWNAEAQEFLTRFTIRKTTFTKLVQGLLNNVDIEPVFVDLGAILKDKMDKVIKETDIHREQLNMIKNFVGISRGRQSALDAFGKNIQLLGDPSLTSMFTQDSGIDQAKSYADLIAFVKRIYKKNIDELTPADIDRVKARSPETHKQFNALRNTVEKGRKEAVRDIVRQSGKKIIKLTEMVRKLKERKIQHRIPTFDGYMDELGNYYTSAGIRINIKSVTGRIEMNPKYDPELDNTYVFEHYPLIGSGAPARVYTVKHAHSSINKKFSVVDELIKNLPALRKRWLVDLKGPINSEKTIAALIVELTYITSARIGTVGTATGLSTLVCKEFSDRATDYFTLNYTGKAGIKQSHKIKTKDAVTKHLRLMLQKLCSGKKPNQLIMTYGPTDIHVNADKVNKYLKSIGAPAGVTIHKFRHARGTAIAKSILDNHPFGKGTRVKEAEANKWLVEKLKLVGQEVGHMTGDKVTASTAISSYIDPNLLKNWFDSLGIRPSATIQKAIDMALRAPV